MVGLNWEALVGLPNRYGSYLSVPSLKKTNLTIKSPFQAANFLDLMAKKIDNTVTPVPQKDAGDVYEESLANGNTDKPFNRASNFSAMRRRLVMKLD